MLLFALTFLCLPAATALSAELLWQLLGDHKRLARWVVPSGVLIIALALFMWFDRLATASRRERFVENVDSTSTDHMAAFAAVTSLVLVAAALGMILAATKIPAPFRHALAVVLAVGVGLFYAFIGAASSGDL